MLSSRYWAIKLTTYLVAAMAVIFMGTAHADVIKIGLRAHSGIEKGVNQWQPTADYLSRQIPEHQFVILPFEHIKDLSEAASRGELDFVLTNPSSYVEMEMNYGAARILTLLNRRQNIPLDRFGSVIFTRNARGDIQTIGDLKGKIFMAVSERAFGGWRVAWRELIKNHGLNPQTDFASLTFGGGIQENVVFAVRDGKADAGVVRTDMLERMAANGEIDLNEFRVLGERKSEGFPFKHSTQLYPEWPIAKFTQTPEELAKKVAIKLLNISSSDPAAIAGKYLGWTVPLNYQSVHNLLRELRVSPYEGYGQVTITEAVRQHWVWVLSLTVALIVTLLTSAVAARHIRIRRGLEIDLRQSEERFKDFAESSSDWFWEMDENLRFTHFSEGYYYIIGIDPGAYIGKTRAEISAENINDKKWLKHFDDLDNHQPFRDFAFDLKTPDGAKVPVRINGKPVFDRDGVFRGYRGTGTDITERKALEEQLRQSQKMEVVGHLAGGVAHDFNNLLNIMMGRAELLGRRFREDENVQHDVEVIIGSVKRGAALTERLLAFSRRQALSPQPTDINELVFGLEDMLQRTLGETVGLTTNLGSGNCVAQIDPHQFENAMINLAVNAQHAMPEGGVLTIETACVILDDTYAEQNEDVTPGDYVRVAVGDTGTGMAPEVLERVYDPFFTTKEVGKGSGLGLSMVYGFAKQSNGHIVIDSKVGHGTTVSLYLPRSEDAIPQEDITDNTPEIAWGSERILLVEDDEDVRKIPTIILREQGYEVVEAEDGKEAIKKLQDGPPFDLLFTDVVLPGGMNGVEIADEAKRIQPNIKALFTSGYPEDAVTHNGKLDRGVTLVNKPYRRKELLEKVRAILDRAGD